MSDDPEAAHERAAIQHMMRRLDKFARELGLNEAVTRLIAESVTTEMPMRTDDEQLAEARAWIVAASGKR